MQVSVSLSGDAIAEKATEHFEDIKEGGKDLHGKAKEEAIKKIEEAKNSLSDVVIILWL